MSLFSSYVQVIILKFCFVADQVYGDEDMHSVVRQLCVDYMVFILLCDYSNL